MIARYVLLSRHPEVGITDLGYLYRILACMYVRGAVPMHDGGVESYSLGFFRL